MHHYLPKKVAQTKIKFHVLNNETDRIEDELLFTAEHTDSDDPKNLASKHSIH